ncbi:MAG TPA: hypothetical protein VE684_06405 [Crenalkalicoccus sp.]|nr:hypothetical protein [Crenalkalicoccus sp.]
MTMATGVAAVALFAGVHSSASGAEYSSRAAKERHACAVVLGLDSSERAYDICITSLDTSVSAFQRAQRLESDRNACAKKALNPGTSTFAICVVEAEQSQANALPDGAISSAH